MRKTFPDELMFEIQLSEPKMYQTYFVAKDFDEIIGYVETKNVDGLYYNGKHYGVLKYNFYNFGYHFSITNYSFGLHYNKVKILMEQNYTIEEVLAND